MLAHHYEAALDLARAAGGETAPLAGRARAAFAAAGDRAISMNAFAAAVAHYRRTLELTDKEDAGLLLRYGIARFFDTTTGEAELSRAVELLLAAGDLERAAEAQVPLTELASIAGDRDLTDERLERAEELAAALPVSRAKAYVLSTVSRFRMLFGPARGGHSHGRRGHRHRARARRGRHSRPCARPTSARRKGTQARSRPVRPT